VVNIIGAKAVDLTAGMTGQFLAMRKKIRLSGRRTGSAGARQRDDHADGEDHESGRKELRWALVEVAHIAANSNLHWKAELARLQPRLGRNRAIVAIAWQILELVWSVLMRRQPYRGFSHERIAYKYLTWVWKAVSISKIPTKSGSDDSNSEPLFISASLSFLFLPFPLTLLLIGGMLLTFEDSLNNHDGNY